MTIDEAYRFLNFLVNSNQSGKITPENFNTVFPRAGKQFFLNQIKRWQDTQVVTDSISIFISTSLLNIPTNGQIVYPSDYVDKVAVRHLYYKPDSTSIEVPVTEVNTSHIGKVDESTIVSPTKRYPTISFYGTYLQFKPKDIGTIIFDYFREPVDPVWGFTTVNSRPVYDVATSTQIEFRDKDHNELVMMAASYLGLNLSMPDVIQAAELFKTQNI